MSVWCCGFFWSGVGNRLFFFFFPIYFLCVKLGCWFQLLSFVTATHIRDPWIEGCGLLPLLLLHVFASINFKANSCHNYLLCDVSQNYRYIFIWIEFSYVSSEKWGLWMHQSSFLLLAGSQFWSNRVKEVETEYFLCNFCDQIDEQNYIYIHTTKKVVQASFCLPFNSRVESRPWEVKG